MNFTMSRPQLTNIFLLVVLLIGGSQAKPVRGLKRSFGMGLLGGALAGAVVSNAVAKSHGSHKAAAPAASPVAQVVETGVPDANGCYKQTIKEPVAGNPKLYTETVHLVCPPPVNPQPAMVVPAQVVQSPAAVQPVYTVAAPVAAPNSTNATGTQVHPGAASAPAAAPAPAPVPARPSGLTVVYAAAPAVATQPPVQPGVAQVVLLSKTVKKQRSAASSLNISHGLIILLVLYCLIRQ